MAWLFLICAGFLEAGWFTVLKLSHESERYWPKFLAYGISILSFLLMERASKTMPIGTSYAVWTGVGTIVTAFIGVMLFKESSNPFRLLCIVLVVAGVIGLRLTAK